LQPGNEFFHEGSGVLFAADEIVIANKHKSPGSEPIEILKLRDNLAGCLVTDLVSEEFHDLAKFAVKRAPSGSLNNESPVIFQFQQIEPWNGRMRKVRFLVTFDHPGFSIPQSFEEHRNGILCLALDHVITSRGQRFPGK
jgi:hypothetical protein